MFSTMFMITLLVVSTRIVDLREGIPSLGARQRSVPALRPSCADDEDAALLHHQVESTLDEPDSKRPKANRWEVVRLNSNYYFAVACAFLISVVRRSRCSLPVTVLYLSIGRPFLNIGVRSFRQSGARKLRDILPDIIHQSLLPHLEYCRVGRKRALRVSAPPDMVVPQAPLSFPRPHSAHPLILPLQRSIPREN